MISPLHRVSLADSIKSSLLIVAKVDFYLPNLLTECNLLAGITRQRDYRHRWAVHVVDEWHSDLHVGSRISSLVTHIHIYWSVYWAVHKVVHEHHAEILTKTIS